MGSALGSAPTSELTAEELAIWRRQARVWPHLTKAHRELFRLYVQKQALRDSLWAQYRAGGSAALVPTANGEGVKANPLLGMVRNYDADLFAMQRTLAVPPVQQTPAAARESDRDKEESSRFIGRPRQHSYPSSPKRPGRDFRRSENRNAAGADRG